MRLLRHSTRTDDGTKALRPPGLPWPVATAYRTFFHAPRTHACRRRAPELLILQAHLVLQYTGIYRRIPSDRPTDLCVCARHVAMHRMRFTYALHARSACSKAGLRACVRACMNHAVMDGWIDGACSRHLACMHADDDDDAVAWPGRPAVGVRGSGPPSEPEAAVGLTVLSTAPLHRCIIQSFIVGPGGPASPCARTSPPVPAPGPAPCCCRSGRRPADTAPGEAMRGAGRPAGHHAC